MSELTPLELLNSNLEDTTTYEGKVISCVFDELEVKEADKGTDKKKTRKIRGWANKNIVDRGNERIEPLAFANAMEGFMQNPILFYNHNWNTPIGKVTDFDVSEGGLFIEAELGHDFEDADKVWKQIEQGLLKSFSVGLRPIEMDEDEEGVLVIKDLELFEVSVVTIPMNADSMFEMTKSRDIKAINFKNSVGEVCTYKQLIDATTPDVSEPSDDELGAGNPVEIKNTLSFVEGTCHECGEDGVLLSSSVNAYGKEFYSCYSCVSKANKSWHEVWALKESLVDELSIKETELTAYAADLEAALEEVSSEKSELESEVTYLNSRIKKYEDVLANEVLDTIKSAVKLVTD